MATRVLQTSHTFAPAAASVPQARRFARAALEGWGLNDVADDFDLLVSELVTNAIMHAGTPVTLKVRIEERGVRVDVEDLHPSRLLRMSANPPTETDEHGRGLLITAALAAVWGVEYRTDSKRVWAVLPLMSPPTPWTAGASEVPTPASTGLPARQPPSAPADEVNPLGLRSVILNRLELDDLLALVVEQARERLAADASYLLLLRGTDERFTVTATSGLPVELRGRTIDWGEPGAPHRRSPFLPISIDDLGRTPVELLAGQPLGSLILAPVAFDGRVIGALATASARVAGFTSDDAALLQRAADWVASAVDRAWLRAAERERRGWLSFLADSSALLAASLDPEMTVMVTGQIVVPRLATWCGVYLNEGRGRPRLHHAWHADENQLDPVRSMLERASPDHGIEPTDPALYGEVTSLPLYVRDRVIGWLVLGRQLGEPMRGELLTVAESFAARAALAIDNARAHSELHEIGHTLQRSLLPASVSVVPGIDVGVVYEPAGEDNDAGGDFYDFFPSAGGQWCFVVGDVCGTGPEAAAITGMARHTIRALLRSGFPVGSTLERLNEAILDEGERGRFLTLVCGTLETPSTGSYRVRMVCAGHPPPFLLRDGDARRRVVRIGRPQPLVGVLDRVSYTEEEYRLQRGDRFVVVTDGVLERRDGSRMFDDEGVEGVLAGSVRATAQGIAERLLRAVTDFSAAPSSDDLAILVMDLGHHADRWTSP